MSYDVVVVGGGIGGLTVAALLSARGVKTCLLERNSQVGGCVARVEFAGHDFEPGMGLYASFGPGQIYDRLFGQLPVDAPETSLLTTPYVVRRSDGTDVRIQNEDLYSIRGGPASVAERLAESLKKSGGTLRLNSPVLRLAYDQAGDQAGRAIGVDLLSGETVIAKKAIVSNLTVWDTYGKLVGLNRTPLETKKLLNTLQGSGAYLVYASMEEAAVSRLPGERFRIATNEDSDDDFGEFTVAVSPAGGAPAGKRAVTLMARTDVTDWFSFQSSEEDYEERDQAALEQFWSRLHTAVPELGADIEVIETANPRTYYDTTRRKLGMVLGVEQTSASAGLLTHQTSLANVFMVGDTVAASARMDAVVESALALANHLTK
jgi:prolycopene isomerase